MRVLVVVGIRVCAVGGWVWVRMCSVKRRRKQGGGGKENHLIVKTDVHKHSRGEHEQPGAQRSLLRVDADGDPQKGERDRQRQREGGERERDRERDI